MRIVEIIEYKNNKYTILKRFIDYSGNIEKGGFNVNHVTILTLEENVKEIAHKYATLKKLHLLEGYSNIEKKFINIPDISSDPFYNTKQNSQFWKFLYPIKYRNYNFYHFDLIVKESETHVFKPKSNDEVLFMIHHKKINKLIISN